MAIRKTEKGKYCPFYMLPLSFIDAVEMDFLTNSLFCFHSIQHCLLPRSDTLYEVFLNVLTMVSDSEKMVFRASTRLLRVLKLIPAPTSSRYSMPSLKVHWCCHRLTCGIEKSRVELVWVGSQPLKHVLLWAIECPFPVVTSVTTSGRRTVLLIDEKIIILPYKAKFKEGFKTTFKIQI